MIVQLIFYMALSYCLLQSSTSGKHSTKESQPRRSSIAPTVCLFRLKHLVTAV